MTDLAALTLHLRPTHFDAIPAWTGRAAQAWFLDNLRQVHPGLSAAVHDGSRLRPFTVSSLIPPYPGRGDIMRLSPHNSYRLRVTTLHRDVTTVVMNSLIGRWLEYGIVLHDQPFRVEQIDPIETATFDSLLKWGESASGDTVRLRFNSPTVFHRTRGPSVALPLPDLVFGSLIDRWNAFSPVQFEPATRDYVRTRLLLIWHRVSSQTVSFERSNRGRETGFVGEAHFSLSGGEASGAAHTLAAFATYSGIGARTAMGLGQAEALREHAPHARLEAPSDPQLEC